MHRRLLPVVFRSADHIRRADVKLLEAAITLVGRVLGIVQGLNNLIAAVDDFDIALVLEPTPQSIML